MDIKRIYFRNQYNLKAQIACLEDGRYCLSRYSYPNSISNNEMFDQRIKNTISECIAAINEIYKDDFAMEECTYEEWLDTFKRKPTHTNGITFDYSLGCLEAYEHVFMVTETLQNGKEYTHKKSVLTPVRDRNGKYISEDDRVNACANLLREHYYYNIDFLQAKCYSPMAVADF